MFTSYSINLLEAEKHLTDEQNAARKVGFFSSPRRDPYAKRMQELKSESE
jgi:hypothetical protein